MPHTSSRTCPSKPVGEVTLFLEAMASPEFVAVAIFCTIGLLLTLNVMLRLPDLAATLG